MTESRELHHYFDKPRLDVVEAIPASCRFVLDVGCASGGLGRELKRTRPGVQVRGIEPVAEQAERARTVLDDVLVGTFESTLPATWPAPDCIVFADVLEHLVEPWDAVRRAKNMLHPGGVVVVSVPNIAHASVLAGLLRGRFDYQPYGILDRTHLRFFTRPTAIDLVESAGFQVEYVRRRLDWHSEQFDQKRLRGVLGRALDWEMGRPRRFRGLLAPIADALTCQFVVRAR